jgi:hypothetical protein
MSPPSPALQHDSPSHALWHSWQARFETVDRGLMASEAQDREGWLNAPRIPNPTETQRIQTMFLRPWTEVMETFDAAVSFSPLDDDQRRSLRSYLDLRAAWYRAVMKRFLVPSDQAMRILADTGAQLEAAVVARRS